MGTYLTGRGSHRSLNALQIPNDNKHLMSLNKSESTKPNLLLACPYRQENEEVLSVHQ